MARGQVSLVVWWLGGVVVRWSVDQSDAVFIVANVRMLPMPVLPMSNSILKFNRL